jgi:hypothetical protein
MGVERDKAHQHRRVFLALQIHCLDSTMSMAQEESKRMKTKDEIGGDGLKLELG